MSNNNASDSNFPSVTKSQQQQQTHTNYEENSENTNPIDGGIFASVGAGAGLLPSTSSSSSTTLQKGLSYRGAPAPVLAPATTGTGTSTSVLGGGGQQEQKQEPIPEGGACNLCYEPDSSGRLVEHYNKPTHNDDGNNNVNSNMAIVGRWIPGEGKHISGFKFKRNCGRNVLIGNCSAGVLGRRNYCNGVCQFVKSAKLMHGRVTLYEVSTDYKSMPVDVYLYYNDPRPGYQTIKLVPGQDYTTDHVLAVGVLPKGGTRFYESETVDLLKWLYDAECRGYSSKVC